MTLKIFSDTVGGAIINEAGDAVLKVDAGGKLSMPGLNRRSRRNRVLNSNFCMNTRKKAGTVTLAAGAYGFDMWKAGAAGCTFTFTTIGLDTTINITAGSLVQVVVGEKMVGGNYVMSWLGTSQGKIGAGSYAASGVAASSVAAAANLNIEFGVGTLGLVQLEEGKVVNDYDRKERDEETFDCAYFIDTSYDGVAPGTTGAGAVPSRLTTLSSSTSAYVSFHIIFQRKMYAIPATFNVYNPATGELNGIRNESDGNNFIYTGIGTSFVNRSGAQVQTSTAPPASHTMSLHYFASCEP